MAAPTKPYTFDNTPADTNVIDADEVNDDFDEIYNYLATGVELLAPRTSTLASRPAANAVPANTLHRATDTHDLSWSDGTTWYTLTPAALCNFAATDATGSWATPSGLVWTDVTGYDTEVFDTASNFDPSTGVFTAPVKGMYHFEGSAIGSTSFGDNDQLGLRLVATGSLDSGNFNLAMNSGDSSTEAYTEKELVFGQRVMRLSASATVKMQSYWNGGSAGFSNARLAGYLVQQLP